MSERTETSIDSITGPRTAEISTDSTQEYTFESVQSVSEAVRSTLGPHGKEKMIERPDGSVLITGDGATILNQALIEEPAAELLISAADAVHRHSHDGTTTAIVLGAALVEQAKGLINDGLHPTTVIRGYERAEEIVQNELNSIGEKVELESSVFNNIAQTAMSSSSIGESATDIIGLITDAVEHVRHDSVADPGQIRVVTQPGYSTADSEMVEGVVFRDDPVRQAMPSSVMDATVLLTQDSVQLDSTNMDSTVSIENSTSLDEFVDDEAEEIRRIVRSILNMGVNAVLCSASIADKAQSALTVNNTLGIRQIDDSTLQAAAAVTDGMVVSSVTDTATADLGTGRIRRDETDELFIITGDGEPRSTILLRGPSHEVLAEQERDIWGAIRTLAGELKNPVVPGGGATEIAVSQHIRTRASSIGGREQLAVNAFAEALEEIPRTLAENAGLEPLDTLLSLKRAHSDRGMQAGIDSEGVLRDMTEVGVIERVEVKRRAIRSAAASAQAVLRVDDILFVEDTSNDK